MTKPLGIYGIRKTRVFLALGAWALLCSAIIHREASTTLLSALLSVNVRPLSGTVSLEGSLLSLKVRPRPALLSRRAH